MVSIPCLTVLMFLAGASTEPTDPPGKARLEKLVPGLLEAHDVPAVGIAVANREGVVLTASYGWSRPDRPATEATLFNVASVAKMLSAETILRIAASGVFDIDKTMASDWVDPDIAEDPRHRALTPRHALAHQTGFPNWRSMAPDNRLAFQFDPGSGVGYSGEGFEYVARFAEKLSGTSFPDLVRQWVLVPSGIEGIAFGKASPHLEDFAWSKNSEGLFAPAEIAPAWSAADDLYTTPAAFGQFLVTLLRGDSLTPELENQRRTIQFDMTARFCGQETLAPICPEAIGFGLSGVIFRYREETVLWQGGGDVGERAIAFYVPERNIAVALFANGANGARLFAPIAALFYDNEDYIKFLEFQAARQ